MVMVNRIAFGAIAVSLLFLCGCDSSFRDRDQTGSRHRPAMQELICGLCGGEGCSNCKDGWVTKFANGHTMPGRLDFGDDTGISSPSSDYDPGNLIKPGRSTGDYDPSDSGFYDASSDFDPGAFIH